MKIKKTEKECNLILLLCNIKKHVENKNKKLITFSMNPTCIPKIFDGKSYSGFSIVE